MRKTIAVLVFTAAASLPAAAQDASGILDDVKSFWTMVSSTVVKAAEKMPEEDYAFKPSHDVRSFGQIVGHIADANFAICGAAGGEKKQVGAEKGMTAKADLVKALKESVDFCTAAANKLTAATAVEKVKFFGGERTRAGILAFNNTHDYEHYGNIATYMRIRGVVPPSSEGR